MGKNSSLFLQQEKWMFQVFPVVIRKREFLKQ